MDLKPCPFCGDKEPGVSNLANLNTIFRVGCYECESLGPTRKTEQEAIEAWNNRLF